ncbi:MAG: Crp/Fnr family transcriptional regulator [Coriobacteriia bacterium]|nr:Crp/Fnr family transcriptional regulator [Coriobacteriia bacterium]
MMRKGELDFDATALPSSADALLGDIPVEKREGVLRCMHADLRVLPEGAALLSSTLGMQGEQGLVAGFVLSGSLRAERIDENGTRSILGLFSEGAVILPQDTPLLDDDWNLVACCESRLLRISISAEVVRCDRCMRYVSAVRGNLLTALAKTNQQLMSRLMILTRRTTREKVLALVRQMAYELGGNVVDLPLNRQELADFLLVDRSALSRELSNLRKEGILSVERSRFEILSPEM